MALTYTPAGELGSKAPNFSLTGVDGQVYSWDSFNKKTILCFIFMCNHCPYVKAIEDRIIALSNELAPRGVQFVGICSNDSKEHPEDSFENLKIRWQEKQYGFPYLWDETQECAKNFGAVCTPDIFVYDKQRRLAYRGRLDDSWKDPTQVKRQELKEAISSILEFGAVKFSSHPSMGCSIKWK